MSDITRSEAIKTLKEHLSHWERLLQEHICEEQEGINTISALKLAIASLETDEAYQLMEEQPEFCEDCISRNAVMDMIIEYRDSLADTGKKDALERAYGANYVGMKIAYMPSVLPKTDKPTIIDWNKCHTSEQLGSIATTKNDLGVDCISRTQAIERLKLNFPISQGADNSRDRHRYMQAQADLQAIRELPSVTPQESRWISVSERLPEDRREVLVTAYWHETYQVMMASYYGDGLWWCVPFNNCGEHMQRLKPKAWMPLPHKAESEVKE